MSFVYLCPSTKKQKKKLENNSLLDKNKFTFIS